MTLNMMLLDRDNQISHVVMRKRDSIPPIVSLIFIVYCISLSERGRAPLQ